MILATPINPLATLFAGFLCQVSHPISAQIEMIRFISSVPSLHSRHLLKQWQRFCPSAFTSVRTWDQTRSFGSKESNEVVDECDYHSAKIRIQKYVESRLTSPDRFQSINDRKDDCLMPSEVEREVFSYKRTILHKGVPVLKSPEDRIVFEQFFATVQPKTVIELGTFMGGSSLWMADVLNMLNIPSKVYSMDIDLTLLHENVKEFAPSNLEFLHGSTGDLEKAFPAQFFATCPRPLAIIDDAHAHFAEMIAYFDKFLRKGDYFIIEDGNPYIGKHISAGVVYPELEFEFNGSEAKLNKLKQFLKEYSDRYAVDSFFTDYLGYNMSSNWHGYIRKMSTE
eukprot:m.189606 g.189606  ORF g.189606 m.189606 type:complete len:339 (+) comp39415_c0_seq8:171-1187(+)